MSKIVDRERISVEEEAVQSAAGTFAKRLKENPAEAIAEGAIHVAECITQRKRLTPEDTMWSVVGSARSTGANDVSEQKHTYLAHRHAAPKK